MGHKTSDGKVTEVLSAAASGDKLAAERLLPMVYNELRALAAQAMRQERINHTLQPTAVVHEAYLRLIGSEGAGYDSRNHFFAAGAMMIRRVLVDHARRHQAAKRGGSAQRLLIDSNFADGSPSVDLLALDDALTRLGELDSRQAQVVELRFFGGMSVEETASLLEVSTRTVEHDWRMARAWLRGELSDGRQS